MPTLLDQPLRLLRRLRRRVLLHRRSLAALAAGAAVLLGLQAAAPAAGPTTNVWTATRDLPAGAVLAPTDLERTAFVPESVPAGVVRDPREVLGRTLAAPMTRGEPMTRVRAVGAGMLGGYPGSTAVPLRITDADVVDLLKVGDRVGIVVADPDGREPPQDLLDDAPIVAIPRRTGGGLADGTPGRLVVVAVSSDRAAEIAARAASGILIPVWSR